MRTLLFTTADRKMIKFVVEGKIVRYYDNMWPFGQQIYPMQKENVKSLLASRSPRMQAVGLLIVDANSGKSLEEYESAKGEDELAEIIIKDCLGKGLREVK